MELEQLWLIEVKKYKKVRKDLNTHIFGSDLNKNPWGLRSANWYRFNAPEWTKIKTYCDFIRWCGFEPVIKHKAKLTKDEAINRIFLMVERYKKDLTVEDFRKAKHDELGYYQLLNFWSGLTEMRTELKLNITSTFDGHVYTKDELLNCIHKYYREFNYLPVPKSFDKKINGYPTRKTFDKYFGSVSKAVIEAGYEYTRQNTNSQYIHREYYDKDYLIKIIENYIDKYNKIPTIREMNKEYDMDLKNWYKKHYGSWNKCLNNLGYTLNSVSQYTDDELEVAIREYVKKHGQTPSIQDFNKTGRPSFWCYQQRFGSWNKAIKYYGLETNDTARKYEFDDGEICASGYERTISNWLRENNIIYERNIKYIDFINNYKGKMDCDYKITLDNNEIWYIEMAGYIRTYNYEKLNKIEKNYLYKIQYKKKLLKRQGCNFIIITVEDFKQKSLKDIFYFLKLNETKNKTA